MTRPSADQVWAHVAELVSLRSRCERSRVGCVIVGADGRVVATGYNGPPAAYVPASGAERCSAFCPRGDTPGSGAADFSDCPSVHAELNALLYSDRGARAGGTAFLTRDPCWDCARALAASGVARVVWPRAAVTSEREAAVLRLFRDCGVQALAPRLIDGRWLA